MRTVHGLLQCFILAPFLSTGLAAPSVTSASFTPTESIPACAASPTVFASLGFEFWLQVVFLGPLPPLDVIGYKFAKDNPIRLHHDYYPYFPNQEIQYSRVYIAAQGLPRTLFILGDSFLLSPDFSGAVIWPDSPPSDTFPGWSPFVFDAWTMLNTTEVRFKAVKVCTSTNELELQLRPEGTFFVSDFSLLGLSKNERMMRSLFAENGKR